MRRDWRFDLRHVAERNRKAWVGSCTGPSAQGQAYEKTSSTPVIYLGTAGDGWVRSCVEAARAVELGLPRMSVVAARAAAQDLSPEVQRVSIGWRSEVHAA